MKTNKPYISIVIPVYNAAAVLPGFLDALAQSGGDELEILLIDDGSGDESLDVCQSRAEKDARFRVFGQENRGPSAARNLGLDESRGEFVAFLDADDVLEPSAFRRTLELLPEYDGELWVSDFHRIAGNGCLLDRVYQIEETEKPITDPAYLRRFLSCGEIVWNVWRYIFRRSFLLEHALRFMEGVDCAEDLEFVVRALLCVRKPVFFHNPYYFYRAHYGATLTRRYSAKRVGDLTQMLLASAEHLCAAAGDCVRPLRDKLVREYVINLAMYEELPPSQRSEALNAFQHADKLLEGASSPIWKAVCAAVRMLGIERSAALLYAMKQIKRRNRKRKIEDYEKKCRSSYP